VRPLESSPLDIKDVKTTFDARCTDRGRMAVVGDSLKLVLLTSTWSRESTKEMPEPRTRPNIQCDQCIHGKYLCKVQSNEQKKNGTNG
jgi:hypothetical protein